MFRGVTIARRYSEGNLFWGFEEKYGELHKNLIREMTYVTHVNGLASGQKYKTHGCLATH